MPHTTRTPARRATVRSYISYSAGCEPERMNLLPDIMARVAVPYEGGSILADYTVCGEREDSVYLNLDIGRADGTTLELMSDQNQVRAVELRALATALGRLADEVEGAFPALIAERQQFAETFERYRLSHPEGR